MGKALLALVMIGATVGPLGCGGGGSDSTAHLEISPQTATVQILGSTTLTATASDAAGNAVTVAPEQIAWQSADTAIATVSPDTGAETTVTGVKGGTVDVTATISGTGVTATRSVAVSGVDLGSNDFTLPTGASPDAPVGELSPANTRVLLATSSDGWQWTKLDRSIGDQTNVPTAVVWQGMLWIYFTGYSTVEHPETTLYRGVAVTSDLANWRYKEVALTGVPSSLGSVPYGDPAITVAADDPNTLRLYIAMFPPSSPPAIHSAVSTDGIHFTYEGERVTTAQGTIDPQILWVGDHYEFFCGTIGPGGSGVYHATSSDGLSFTTPTSFTQDMQGRYPSNGAQLADGTYVWYLFDTTQTDGTTTGIRAFTYANGSWTLRSGILLGLATPTVSALESTIVSEAAVVVWPAVGHVMAYMTKIP